MTDKKESLPVTIEAVTSVALGLEKSYPGMRGVVEAALNRTDGLRSSGKTNLPKSLLSAALAEFGSVAAVADNLVVSLAWGYLGRGVPQLESRLVMERIGVHVFPRTSSVEIVVSRG